VKDRKAIELARAEALKKRVTELEKQLTDLQNGSQARAVSNPKTRKSAHRVQSNHTENNRWNKGTAKRKNCWGCSDLNHRLWQCVKLSHACKMKLDRIKIRPIGDHDQPSFITVPHRRKSIQALIDTGSDVTIAGSNIAKKHRWKIRPAELVSQDSLRRAYAY